MFRHNAGMKRRPTQPDPRYVASILRYEPDTGMFFWTVRRSQRVKAGDRAGSKLKNGYWVIEIDDQKWGAAILAFVLMKGVWPKEEMDHEDTDPSNNKWGNLREATRAQNCANRSTYGKEGFRGVSRPGKASPKKPYCAKIFVNGRLRSLGYFATPEEAEQAHLAAHKAIWGEFSPK